MVYVLLLILAMFVPESILLDKLLKLCGITIFLLECLLLSDHCSSSIYPGFRGTE